MPQPNHYVTNSNNFSRKVGASYSASGEQTGKISGSASVSKASKPSKIKETGMAESTDASSSLKNLPAKSNTSKYKLNK